MFLTFAVKFHCLHATLYACVFVFCLLSTQLSGLVVSSPSRCVHWLSVIVAFVCFSLGCLCFFCAQCRSRFLYRLSVDNLEHSLCCMGTKLFTFVYVISVNILILCVFINCIVNIFHYFKALLSILQLNVIEKKKKLLHSKVDRCIVRYARQSQSRMHISSERPSSCF